MRQLVLFGLSAAVAVATMGPPMAAPAQSETIEATTGTGFFVSEDGLILTNNHVVEDCSAVEIRTEAWQQVVGQILARDAKNDLALIRSPARAQKVARFRTSIRVGEEIAAFGFPHSGLLASSGTFTIGTVTSLV